MVDIKEFYFDEVNEDEYYYRFYDFIRNVNKNCNKCVGEQEDQEYVFEVYDEEEAIKKYRELCLPDVHFDNEKKCWFYLLSFFLYKCEYEIKEFPRILARPPLEPTDFTCNDIRSRIISNGDDDNGIVRYSTRRAFVSSLVFLGKKESYAKMVSGHKIETMLLNSHESGDVFEIKGYVGKDIIYSEEVKIPIDINDFFSCTLPSGVREYYKVTDPGFVRKTPEIPEHYETRVTKIPDPFSFQKINSCSHLNLSNNIKYQVFVSSTYKDLVNERRKILEVLLRVGCIPAGMENFVAEDDDQFNVIKRVIDLCDYYILIIGKRYGSINEKTGLSYTEMEYDYAIEKGIPVLVFALDDDAQYDKYGENDTARKKLANFKNKAMKNRLASLWKNQADLSENVVISVMKAISEIKRPGWHRGVGMEKE